jgi:hypothetical protein
MPASLAFAQILQRRPQHDEDMKTMLVLFVGSSVFGWNAGVPHLHPNPAEETPAGRKFLAFAQSL